MKSDLDLLIELLEAEKKALESLIHENSQEFEHLLVYHQSEALMRVNQQLYTLYSFKGPLYEEKEKLDRMIKMTQNLDGYLAQIYGKRIEKQKTFIQQLSTQPDKWFNDDQKIDDALFNLYEGKINGFELYFNRDDDFCLSFKLSKNKILHISINIQHITQNEELFTLENDTNNPLFIFQGLGFKFNTKKNQLIYHYNMQGFSNATPLKTILAHWIYHIFLGFNFDTAMLVYQ